MGTHRLIRTAKPLRLLPDFDQHQTTTDLQQMAFSPSLIGPGEHGAAMPPPCGSGRLASVRRFAQNAWRRTGTGQPLISRLATRICLWLPLCETSVDAQDVGIYVGLFQLATWHLVSGPREHSLISPWKQLGILTLHEFRHVGGGILQSHPRLKVEAFWIGLILSRRHSSPLS